MDASKKPRRNHPARSRNHNSDRSRDAFFVRVVSSDGKAVFVNSSDAIGSPMPFQKPRATLAMSVFPEVVAFSLLHLTPKTAKNIKESPIAIPHGSMTRLRRRAAKHMDMTNQDFIIELSTRLPFAPEPDETLPADTSDTPVSSDLDDLFAEVEPVSVPALAEALPEADSATSDEEVPEKKRRTYQYEITSWTGTLTRTSSHLADLEIHDDTTIELPAHPLTVSLYFKSPSTGRMLAVAFIGHVGRPGSSESIERIASKVMSSILGLPEFQLLADMQGVDVPAGPGQESISSLDHTIGSATFTLPTFCFSDDLELQGHGDVNVTIDLQNANPTSGKLFYSFQPVKPIDGFAACEPMLEAAVSAALLDDLGADGISSITYDIILGGISNDTVHMLVTAGLSLGAVDLTPTKWRRHQ